MAFLSKVITAAVFCFLTAAHATIPGVPTEWFGTNIPTNLTSVELVADAPIATYYVGADGKLQVVSNWSATQPKISGIKALAAGMDRNFGLALLEDGTVQGFGDLVLGSGLPGAPSLGADLTPPADLHDVISIAAGGQHGLAAKKDGTVETWGNMLDGFLVPPIGLTNVTRVACGLISSLALKSDGTVEAWGQNMYGEIVIPPGLSNVVDIAAGGFYSIALLADGSVRVFGDPAVQPSTSLTDVKAIAAGFDFWLALKNDGTVVSCPQIDFRGLKHVTRIYAGMRHAICWTLAPMIWEQPTNQVVAPGTEIALGVRAVSATPLTYQWFFNDSAIVGATNATYQFSGSQEQTGNYWVRLSNADDSMDSKRGQVVIGKPVVEVKASNLLTHEGGSVTFTAQAISPTPITYQWLFNGGDIPGAASDSLTLQNLQLSQAGKYSVRAQNEFGVTTSDAVDLIVTATTPPSTNDAFADAIPIDMFPYSIQGNIRYATREAGEPVENPANGPNTLWWSFKPSQRGVLAALVNAESWGGGRLQVYRGTDLGSLELVPSDGAHFLTEAGVEYRLQLTTTNMTPEDFGEFTLTATFEPTGLNDNFANSAHLEGTSLRVRTWIASATVESNEPLVSSNILGTLWWSWAAPANGRVEISGAAGFAVYSGPTLETLVRVPTTGSTIFSARAGDIYYIQVYSADAATLQATGFDLNFYAYGQATNDNFVDAAQLDGVPKSNVGATREIGEPAHRDGGPNKSIWWKYTSGQSRRQCSIDIGTGTLTNVTIAIYQGGSVDTLHLINKNTGRVYFDTWAGETYYIAAETPAADDGDIVLNFRGNLSTTISRSIPGNIVQNPSFEDLASSAWSGQSGGSINETAPDGVNYAIIYQGFIQQDINTTIGQTYRLRFVFTGAPFAVQFGAVEITPVTVSLLIPWEWQTAEYIVTGNAAVSRLFFRGTGSGTGLDQVSLVPIDQPPQIVTQPVDATVFQGQTATFHVGISGAEPLSKQWYFNGSSIAGATDTTLSIGSVTASNAGSYYLVATNAYGRVESDHATLSVEDASSPQIVLQPEGDRVNVGQYFVLQTAAIGTPPLQFQWMKNGVEMPGETNSAVVFGAFAADQAGQYSVRVSHAAESATSLPAVVAVAESTAQGGGIIWFANAWWMSPEIPIYDVDGVTRVARTNFVAQLYAGASADSLRAVGTPRPFQTGFRYGLWQAQSLTLSNIAPGEQVFAQARVWEVAAGQSYETARALGGKFGRSKILQLTADGLHYPPATEPGTPLIGLESFQLHSGLPNFVTGNLALLQIQSDGTMVWQLTGAAGFRYLIERQTDTGKWLPFTTLLNETGVVTFTDTAAATAQIQIYRARILD